MPVFEINLLGASPWHNDSLGLSIARLPIRQFETLAQAAVDGLIGDVFIDPSKTMLRDQDKNAILVTPCLLQKSDQPAYEWIQHGLSIVFLNFVHGGIPFC